MGTTNFEFSDCNLRLCAFSKEIVTRKNSSVCYFIIGLQILLINNSLQKKTEQAQSLFPPNLWTTIWQNWQVLDKNFSVWAPESTNLPDTVSI